MKKHIATKVCTSLDHHAVTTVLGTGVVADDLGYHRQGITKAQGTEEPEDPALPPRHMITKTTKKRWEQRDLLAEFTPHLYLKGLNCPMTNRNMMDLRSHNHGSQIICKKPNTRRLKRNSDAKSAAPPH
jgi:hypothetical protein